MVGSAGSYNTLILSAPSSPGGPAFLVLSHYGPPEFAQRLRVVADPDAAMRYEGENLSDRGMQSLAPWFPRGILDTPTLERDYPRFTMFGETGWEGRWNWITSSLIRKGWRIEPIAQNHNNWLFLVDRPHTDPCHRSWPWARRPRQASRCSSGPSFTVHGLRRSRANVLIHSLIAIHTHCLKFARRRLGLRKRFLTRRKMRIRVAEGVCRRFKPDGEGIGACLLF